MTDRIDKTVAWSELCDAVERKPGNEPMNLQGDDGMLEFYSKMIIACIHGLNKINSADKLPARLFELCEQTKPVETGETFD